MNTGITRRLEKLETITATTGALDLAAVIEAGRLRVRHMPPEQLHRERQQRLAEMQERHAVRPLRGVERRLMEGLERVCTTYEPPAAAHLPGAIQ